MNPDDETRDIADIAQPRHHRAEIVFRAAAFCFALFLLARLPEETTWVAGQRWTAQPAFWPAVSIAGMTLFGAFEIVFSWRRNRVGRGETILGEIGMWVRTAEFALWFMAYVFLVPLAGYLPTTLFLAIALAVRLGYRDGRAMLAAVIVGLATVIVFKGLLSVKIPGGAVYELLPPVLRNFMILYL